MGGIFSKPKAPPIPDVKEIPDATTGLVDKKRKNAALALQKGVQSTDITGNALAMGANKPLGQ